jgi:hypothetical protein
MAGTGERIEVTCRAADILVSKDEQEKARTEPTRYHPKPQGRDHITPRALDVEESRR